MAAARSAATARVRGRLPISRPLVFLLLALALAVAFGYVLRQPVTVIGDGRDCAKILVIREPGPAPQTCAEAAADLRAGKIRPNARGYLNLR